MVCQFGRGWHTNFGVLCTPNFLECTFEKSGGLYLAEPGLTAGWQAVQLMKSG